MKRYSLSWKIFFVTCAISISLFGAQVFAVSITEDTFGFTQYEQGDYSFMRRVQDVCLSQDAPWSINTEKATRVHTMRKYPDFRLLEKRPSFDEIVGLYDEAQDNIFSCQLIQMKESVIEDMLSVENLPEAVEEVLRLVLEAISLQKGEELINRGACLNPQLNYTPSRRAKFLLDELSYEHCVYQHYLLYYRAQAEHDPRLAIDNERPYHSILGILKERNVLKEKIEGERVRAAEIYEQVVREYAQFEKYFATHLLMETLRVRLLQVKGELDLGMRALESFFKKANNAQMAP